MKIPFAILIALGALLLSAQAFSQMGMMMGKGMMNMSMIRHQFVMRNGIDPKYSSKVNPLQSTGDNIEAGKKLYEQNCASCHGLTGLGDGEAGKGLNPPPANIATFIKMPMATDSYLSWTIAEGGVPIGTAMPPFKDVLKEEQMWRIIIYLRKQL